MSEGSGDTCSAADRLVRFIRRYDVANDKVAKQLGWSEEQLRAYLLPETRRIKAISDIADAAVDKFLMRYRVALAHQTLKRATTRPLKPLDMSCRRSMNPIQYGRSMTDKRSIIHADVTPAQLVRLVLSCLLTMEAKGMNEPVTGNRKRKRRCIVQPLLAKMETRQVYLKNYADRRMSINSIFKVNNGQQAASQDPICPIRLDVDEDGIRYQDTFLVDAAIASCSPELLAMQIFHDEKMTDRLRDAIAESIRRQILLFTSSSVINLHKNTLLYPIYLDLIVDGYSLRDQFEWDVSNDYRATQIFAATLCADLKLPQTFEPAIVFSIYEQVVAYRIVLSGQDWVGTNPLSDKETSSSQSFSRAGYIEVMPPLDDIIRSTEDTKLWQPVLSELSQEEKTYLSARFKTVRAPTTWRSTVKVSDSADRSKRFMRRDSKDSRLPRPINPFIVFCQMQKDAIGKTRRSASETRKIMGDMWRKCTDEEKERYSQLTEVENEKRRRDHLLDIRDRAIAEWEEDEARRKGLLASGTLEASAEHFRGLLLENYMSERHEVDMNRPESVVEMAEEGENDEINEYDER